MVKQVRMKAKRKPTSRKISSPKVLEQFSPVSGVIRKSSHKDLSRASGDNQSGSDVQTPAGHTRESATNSLETFSSYQKAYRKRSSFCIAKKTNEIVDAPPASKKSHFFIEASQKTTTQNLPENGETIENAEGTNWIIEDCEETKESIVFCGCGKECKGLSNMCQECIDSGKIQAAVGYLYLKRDKSNLDRYWFKLVDQDIYRNFCAKIGYKNREDVNYISMTNIKDHLVKEEADIISASMFTIYPFSISSRWNKNTFYCLKPGDRKTWIETIHRVLCYSDIYKEYNIGEFLGKGRYGEVRKCVHKETGKIVAIKILNKQRMKIKNYDMVRNEIEVLKLCQHPNIVRLYDVLENSNYIFLVMEYLGGGNLLEYMNDKNNEISESQTKSFVKSIALALEYIGKFGILHRDIKLLNILLSDDFVVKIADFGLAVILGPSQQCKGYAGTLNFCSPEVIIGLPYSQKADVWSMGIVAWFLLNGSLPFNSTNSNKLKK